MKKLLNLAAASLFLLSGFAVYFQAVTAPSAWAATGTTAQGQALEIAPPLINQTVSPGQSVKTEISLRKVSGGNLVVKGQVNDFVASGETGTPKILLDETESDPYSIKGWVAPIQEFLTVPRKIYKLPITINVPANASPGGHYGVIRFTTSAPGVSGNGVSLAASLGSLVLLTVKGNITESLSIEEFSVNHSGKTGKVFESTPLTFVERIKNTGNVHEEPQGLVTITDMFGKKVATLPVNQPPKNVLPDSIRRYEEQLDKTVIGNKRLFGKYTAKLNLTYGSNNQTLAASLTFWVIPYRLIAIVIALLVLGFLALRFFIKRYNRHIIGKAGRRR